jgi:hypothetical protein
MVFSEIAFSNQVVIKILGVFGRIAQVDGRIGEFAYANYERPFIGHRLINYSRIGGSSLAGKSGRQCRQQNGNYENFPDFHETTHTPISYLMPRRNPYQTAHSNSVFKQSIHTKQSLIVEANSP